ncbi:MAG: SDR family NAD(P)-dependent oxidoreductase [Novosphingobium sp.]|uniref:SDR family NAD(P)-dependent oxidoreductase n=1 Tax=Novosphingobium sp. TaxID=1874826 RepID=UPI0012CF754E|nr:SDR family NAD(P)-dependent oxidoreductase [Novosphingobium sp.]MPS69759.1 SDR family NAD(P)-dependent oxidoreductase [Novosphingobium sp.]
MDLHARYGPWALIAGASEGTGAAFARQLAAQGFNLILVARRLAPLNELAETILTEHGVTCLTASIDLSSNDAADRLLELAEDREIGLLILNAGADANGAPFLDGALANWDALVMRNVMTVMRACHHFAAPMRARGRGGVILCGSGACYGGLPGIAAYAGSKAFDLVFGEALWAELQPHGVDVLNLVMGRTDTPAHRELLARQGKTLPDGCASPEDVAALGLARLPHGPICNWGLADEDAGYAGSSAAQRRNRIRQISAAIAGQEAE